MYEKNWWKKNEPEMNLGFYKEFADELIRVLSPYSQIDPHSKILEIGSGAAGIITHINSMYKFAIDPLEDYYSSVQSFADYRDKTVLYQKAVGEDLPFENEFFDFIIMDNVLDHCNDPVKVFSEIKRVLRRNGYLYLRQNIYHKWGQLMRSLMELFLIDKGHPHTFTRYNLENLIQKFDFNIILTKRTGYFQSWKREILSKRIIDKIKALIFVNRDKTTFILKKR